MIWQDGTLYAPGRPIMGDRMVGSLRVWPPERSKLSALYYLGSGPEIHKTDQVLYLGAASGTTISFLADYAGIIYAVEMARDPLPQLLNVCRVKKNVIPIPADAMYPDRYAPLVSIVDLLYQDIAQRDQVDIAIRNLYLLKENGILILMLKTRSIASHQDPVQVCDVAVNSLKNAGMDNIEVTWLDKFHRNHAAIVCIKKTNFSKNYIKKE